MVIQIDFKKDDERMGNIHGRLRINGKNLFFKFNNHSVAQQMISKMRAGGAIIIQGPSWVRVNIFRDLELVKLGGKEFNPQEKTEEQLEVILTEYYQFQYNRAGFSVETKKLK